MATGLPITQKVPRFVGGDRIERWERPVPRPGHGELLLAVRANALCGTDRAQLAAGSAITPGHEAAGEVVAAGHGTLTAIGTAGVVYLMDFCGRCRSCSAAATNRCTAKRADVGFTQDGGFGRYVLVHESNFFPVETDLALDEATLLLDVMGTTSHALRRALAIRPHVESLAVAGAGPVGLGVVAMARLLLGPAVRVVVADVIQYRLDLAERLGALPVRVPGESLTATLAASDLHDGVDVAIDTSGRGAARRMLLDSVSRGGALVCVGHGEVLEIDVSADLIAPERGILGSEYFRYDELTGNLELLRANRGYLGQIITHRFGIGELEEAYRVFLGGDSGKVVITQ
jgi:threonine 3-dehydrogenase